MQMTTIRESVRGILPVESENGEKKIVLMHRIKKWQEYHVVPWGGIEKWENHEIALKREMEEEINAAVSIKHLLVEHVSDLYNTIQYFYLCSQEWWEIKNWKWVEFSLRSNPENIYEVQEVSVDELLLLNIAPASIKQVLLNVLMGDVPEEKILIKE